MTTDAVRQAVDAVAQFLVADARLGSTLERIAELARDAVRRATAVGITLSEEAGRPSTRIFTDEISPAVDQGQYDDGVGPCVDALRDGEVVLVPDVRACADRWPEFVRLAGEHAVLSTLSLPLVAAGDRMGVLNLYSTDEAFTEDDVTDAQVFATHAAVVLTNVRTYWEVFDLAAGLRTALASRAVIDQAKGKLMASRNCSADEAFQLLVHASQRENVRLRDIARRMVDDRRPQDAAGG